MISFTMDRARDIDRPAEGVWAVLADYERDPEWREGVMTMDPSPAGIVRPGTTTREELHLAGAEWRNEGVVTDVGPGLCFRWRTTSGAQATGSRHIEARSAEACQVRLQITVTLDGELEAMAPAMEALLQETLDGDLERLERLVTAVPATARR